MDIEKLMLILWRRYTTLNPDAKRINRLIKECREQVTNDHIAFRTFDHPKININQMAKTFIKLGYKECGQYVFEKKKLIAKHYEHSSSAYPKIFISQLQIKQCSRYLQNTIKTLLKQMDLNSVEDNCLPLAGRIWPAFKTKTYQRLLKESEYAAWTATFGLRANHFTLLVNDIKTFSHLKTFNTFLKNSNIQLSQSGGEIKGNPQVYLEQSSTIAPLVNATFTEGEMKIPGCYYEFAYRHPMENGNLFNGFVTQSADKIFESTNVNQKTMK